MVALTNPKMHMGTITGGEPRDLYATTPIVLLPLGSHKDQGPHVPMGDHLLAAAIAERAGSAPAAAARAPWWRRSCRSAARTSSGR